jgi:LPXTG-motif cell wall-anchored protein
VLCGIAVKLAFVLHPLITIGDAVFQVHRAQLVHAGTYFFTSVTPKPFFEFPYAIALYIVALPFWRFFPTVPDLVRLLRGVALIADALVGLALYAAARRQWNDGPSALWCAGLWLFARAPVQALCNANLTNLFGQAMFGMAMGVIAWTGAAPPAAHGEHRTAGSVSFIAGMVVACGLFTVAFLSHFGTLSVGVPIACATGVLCIIAGRSAVRMLGLWVVVSVLAASVVAYGVYYSNPRFTPVYRQTLARVLSPDEPRQSSKMVAPAATKARRLLAETGDDYGLPGVVLGALAFAGAALLVARRRRDGFTLMLLGWGVAWAGMTALGIVTPIEMRTNLAAAPAFVCLGAYALGHLATRSRAARAVATIATVAVGWAGLRLWLMCIGR